MFNKILDFIESKIEDFERPTMITSDDFSYGVNTGFVHVPENIEDNSNIDELLIWWYDFMMDYIDNEFDLSLSICDGIHFSFLHEIGHYMTLKGIDPDAIINSIEGKDVKSEYEYRQLTVERMADLWAIAFIEEYPEVLDIILREEIVSL